VGWTLWGPLVHRRVTWSSSWVVVSSGLFSTVKKKLSGFNTDI